jgi:hypothetical protein
MSEHTTYAIIVPVRYRCQAYSTAKIQGKTGSSTMSPEAAVLTLANKLYGERARLVVEAIEPCPANAQGFYRVVSQVPLREDLE